MSLLGIFPIIITFEDSQQPVVSLHLSEGNNYYYNYYCLTLTPTLSGMGQAKVLIFLVFPGFRRISRCTKSSRILA